MWQDILKSPYKIHSTTYDSLDDSPLEDYVHTYSKLFQGTQGEEDTGYWTPSLDEALVYAIFGSSKSGLKLENKPSIKQSVKTNRQIDLEGDREYTDYRTINNKKELGMPRGFSHDENIEYKQLPDSRVKEMILDLRNEVDSGLTQLNAEYIYSAIGFSINNETENKIIYHIDEILERYF
tara:strand:+ start:14253 stop:14792 length:540 start_codon:yes stop_codon:yes gene_type:complete